MTRATRFNTADRAEFLALLSGRRSVSFSGRTHTTEHHYFSAADGFLASAPNHHHVLTAVSGSWWSGPLDRRGIASADSRDGTPHGFHILSIDGGALRPASFPPLSRTRGKCGSASTRTFILDAIQSTITGWGSCRVRRSRRTSSPPLRSSSMCSMAGRTPRSNTGSALVGPLR
jgi:C terminal of Calcineurin-like phosphoesterase